MLHKKSGRDPSGLKTQEGETAKLGHLSCLLTSSPEAVHQVSHHSKATNVSKNVKSPLPGFRPRSNPRCVLATRGFGGWGPPTYTHARNRSASTTDAQKKREDGDVGSGLLGTEWAVRRWILLFSVVRNRGRASPGRLGVALQTLTDGRKPTCVTGPADVS